MAADTLITPDAESRLWTRRFLWLLAGVFMFRVVYLFTAVDFQLGGDEAYYWDWGRRPDWCYYSKPPLIGWLMGLLRITFGYHWWAVRLAAITLGTVSLGLLFALGRRLFDARSGFFAALMLLLTPANAAANFAFTIDSPLVLCWTSGLLVFWTVTQKPENRLGWLLLTLVIGIGALAKQMMLAFPGVMLLYALLSPEDRGLLKRPAFWLCILGGLAFMLPLVWWNEQHGWVTLTHTKEHFHHQVLGLGRRVWQFVSFPIYQAGIYTPITFGLMMVALWSCLRSWKTLARRERFLLLFSAPGLAVFVVLAMRQDVNPNWPAVFYLAAFVLGAGHALQQRLREARRWGRQDIGDIAAGHDLLRPWLECWLRPGLKLGGAVVLFIYLIAPLIPVLGWKGHKKFDPFVSMRGWDEAGKLVGQLYEKVPDPAHTFVFVLDHRHNASQMAFHMPQHPRVYRWSPEGKIESQYEVWLQGEDKTGWDGFVIYPDSPEDGYKKKPLQSVVAKSFKHTEKLGDADVMVGNGVQRSFQVFLCKDLQHWPGPDALKTSAARKPPPSS